MKTTDNFPEEINSKIIFIMQANPDMEFKSPMIAPLINKSLQRTSLYLGKLLKKGFLHKIKFGTYKLSKIKTLDETIDDFKRDKNTNGQTLGNFIKKLEKNMFGWQDELIKETNFLDEHYKNITIGQRLYHLWFKKIEIEVCKVCGNPKKFGQYFSLDQYRIEGTGNYRITCESEKCQSQLKKDFQLELKNDPIKKEKWINKIKESNLRKRGVEWNVISADFKKKSEETCMKKHGVSNGSKSTQAKETYKRNCLKKYGVDSFFKTEISKQKTREFYENLGVTHNTHIPEIFDKMVRKGYKLKDYVLPSKKIVKVQGYEYITIDRLFKEGFSEEDLVIGNRNIENCIGKIMYTGIDGKIHRYYPDVYIKSLNKIIEVKSTYTFKCDGIKNQLKKKACEEAGFLFEFDVHEKPKK